MDPKKYDAIIIGSGQAGTPLAFSLAKKGKQVAFIEKQHIGGTCLNVGCTPTKTYVASARRMWDIAHSEELGVEVEGTFKANMNKVKKRKDQLIAKSVDGITKSIKDNENIDLIEGSAAFQSNKVVEVNDQTYTADQIFINVGGRPMIPDEYSGINYLTNETILQLTDLPEHLVIIGGSYIGLEFGQMFRRFGSQVTILERSDRIISKEDEDVSEEILKFMREEGIEFVLEAKDIKPSQEGEDIVLTINADQQIKASHLLLAIGRQSNIDLLSLENTDIKTNDRGYIDVNEHCQTNVSGVFALGDCNGEGAFTHTAYNDFQIVNDYLHGEKERKVTDRIMTYGLFVDPPLGRCGLTKKQALDQGINLKEAKRPMNKISRAKEKGETNGFMKILVNADTEQIVGACVLGTGGDEIITSILNVMYAKQPYKLIRDSVVLHPTVSELIPTTLENLSEVNE